MELKNYVNEIIDIACANNMSWDIGLDMFVANIQNSDAPENKCYYHGADEVDYAALRPEWMEMEEKARWEARFAFEKWSREKQEGITAARRAGMRVIPE